MLPFIVKPDWYETYWYSAEGPARTRRKVLRRTVVAIALGYGAFLLGINL
jgi:hypothetical protein